MNDIRLEIIEPLFQLRIVVQVIVAIKPDGIG